MVKNFNKLNWVGVGIFLLFLVGISFILYMLYVNINKELTNINATLINLEVDVKKLEKLNQLKEFKELKEKLNILENKVQSAGKVLDTFNRMKPKIQIVSDIKEWKRESDNLIVRYSINNMGEFGCFIEKPKFVITTKEMINEIEVKGRLIEGLDYILQTDSSPGTLNPNKEMKYEQIIILNNKRLPKTFDKIYIMAIFRAKTNPTIFSSLPFFLKEIIGEEKLSHLSESKFISQDPFHFTL